MKYIEKILILSVLGVLLHTTSSALAAANELASPAALPALAGQVEARRLEADVQTLVGFGTRHTLSDTESETRGIGAARRWIESEFREISRACGDCLEVFTLSDVVQGRRVPEPTEVVDVLAVLRGSRDPNRYVVMSGDIDSRVSDPMNFTSDSPGANDNASGMAGVLEAARVLSAHEFPASIIFAGLSGEEQGLYGGRIMAEHAADAGWHLQAVLNNDMIGNIEGVNGVVDNTTARVFSEGTRATESADEARLRRFTGGEVDSASRNLARFIDHMADAYLPNLDVMMIYRLDRFGRGGHHRPFNDLGYPAVRIMETNENYNRQHQDLRVEDGIAYGDVIAGVNFAYAAKLTALNVISLAAMASAPTPPADVMIEGAVEPTTRLRWSPSAGAAGYRVHWRLTTSPIWTHSRFVGDVTQAELENLVIDNYLFGVSSISSSGFESPVVFPGPAGAMSPGTQTQD